MEGFMKRIAIMVAALVAVAACSKGAKSNATDTSTAGGAVAPASDSTGAMGGSMGGGAMSSDSASKNQSQSGMTDSSGKSTLGPDANQTSPTSGSPVTAKGDTLKKADSTKKAP
jgi:hypothetical protein